MTRKLVLRLVWCSLICFGSINVRAERLPVKIYTSADGLGSSFVDYLFRDSRGFMWFCTRDGLSRFDGAQFITYRVGDTNSPPGIERMSETGGGVYWITTTGGLYRFKSGALSRPDKEIGNRPFLNAEYVDEGRGSVLEDRVGNVWYIGKDLYLLREKDGKVEFERKNLNLPSNPNLPLTVFQMREGPDGSFWINTNQGLVRRLPDGRITLLQHESSLRLGLAALTIERGGRVWVAWGGEIYVIQPQSIEALPQFDHLLTLPLKATRTLSVDADRETKLPDQPGEIVRLTKKSLGAVTMRLNSTSDGHVWLASNDELLEFDGRGFHSYNAAQGLPTGMAEMCEDAAGNLWIGGRTLMRLDRKGLISYYEEDGLKSSALFAINEGTDGTLHFANGDFYLSSFDGKRFQTSRPQVDTEARALWSSRYAFLSSANEWWILTTTMLYRFAAANLKKPLAVFDSHNGLAANEAFQISEDSHGDIWLSQQPSRAEDFGLYRLKRGEGKFHRFSAAENLPAGKSASSFAEDRNGNLWFGFYEGGLARFANNRFEEFTPKDGLATGLVIDLHLDQKGRLWLGSTRSGLQRIDDPGASKPVFASLTTDNGLSSNNVRTITEDKLGNIYIGTVRGVDRISPNGHIKHYSVNDGLAGDFVVDSHCDRQGVVWFATTNGLSRLVAIPEEVHPPPKILLGGLRIAGEKQAVSELGEGEIQTGELSPTRNNLQIDFFGLDFRPGERLRYQFMLEGADSSWSPASEQRTVAYANLKAGTYRFLVRALSADGIVSDKPAVVSFRILPPIWLRWWFLALATLLTLALLYLFYRYRMSHLRQVNAALADAKRAEEHLGRAREERLAELERVRSRIATDLHDDIGASLTQIAILSEVAQQSIKGNGASLHPLKSIASVSNDLVETMSDIVWAINPQKDHLRDLILRMRRFASDILSARGINLEFNAPAFETEIPLGANPRREVFLIFKESLTNIVKHSGATQVRIEFKFSQEYLTLKITDNGAGFDVNELGRALFVDQKGGHGIFSMKKRAAEMNGKFEIDSEVGKGTVVVFQLPLSEPPAAVGG
jgi:signal transduction histidine kinase/ligand-binding sensor domain-containing protein